MANNPQTHQKPQQDQKPEHDPATKPGQSQIHSPDKAGHQGMPGQARPADKTGDHADSADRGTSSSDGKR